MVVNHHLLFADFTLKDQNNQPVTLSDYRGKTVVLAWFPKAFTGG